MMREIDRLAERCSVRRSRLLPREVAHVPRKKERQSDSSPACVHQVSTCSGDPIRLTGGEAELPNRVGVHVSTEICVVADVAVIGDENKLVMAKKPLRPTSAASQSSPTADIRLRFAAAELHPAYRFKILPARLWHCTPCCETPRALIGKSGVRTCGMVSGLA